MSGALSDMSRLRASYTGHLLELRDRETEVADLKAQARKHDADGEKWKQQIAVYEEMIAAKNTRIAELEAERDAWKAKALTCPYNRSEVEEL